LDWEEWEEEGWDVTLTGLRLGGDDEDGREMMVCGEW
jgi:hypothetical protein